MVGAGRHPWADPWTPTGRSRTMSKKSTETEQAPEPGTVTTETQNGKTADTQPGGATPPNSEQTAMGSTEGQDQIGDAGKRAIQSEREAREEAEEQARIAAAELTAFKDALAKALGFKDDTETDPKALTSQLAERDKDLARTRAENAVLRAGSGIADLDLLLDSKRFTDTLESLDVSDTAKVKAHIEKWVEDNPQYRLGKVVPGARDAGAGRGKESLPEPPPGAARMAQGFEAELNK